MSTSFINPIIPGFAPDPSIVLVDDTFFLVNSTFHVFPGLPIYASKDLISWNHIGNAIHRQSQLSLAVSKTNLNTPDERGDIVLSTGGLYAPTIRYAEGTFYVVCTNVIQATDSKKDKTENFIVSTRDIWSNTWSDLIQFDFHGIDPSIFFDDDGKVYMQGSAGPGPMTKIHLFQIDLKTGRKLSEERTIWSGTGGIFPEGPHLYKKDGFYYLLISEGGTFEDHMITMARSRNIWGPYESYQRNPILTARGTDNYIRHTGHCEIFHDDKGSWWGVFLGVRKYEERFVMGRETFLTTAEWPDGEWPSLKGATSNPTLADGKEIMRSEGSSTLRAEPGVDYLYIRDAKLNDHKFSSDNKTITIIASKADMSQYEEPVTFVGKRQRFLDGTASVIMHKASAPSESNLKTGLSYYKDEHRHMKLFYDFSSGEIVFEIINNAKAISRASRKQIWLQDAVALRIQYTERSLQFSYQNGGGSADWSSFESVDTLDLTGPDFVGPVIGVFATADLEDVQVQFGDLEIDAT
ncbi:glycoside hydrolase family 43 protein [Cadophora sp. DSE1049]|nr:glycoside hydrolase family 43 protein [Cadophora sp. DSE1049]